MDPIPRMPVRCALAFALACVAPAQADAFDAAIARGATTRETARGALEAFLRIEPGGARDARVADAARCAFDAGDLASCVRLCEEAERKGALPATAEIARLRALVALRRAGAFLAAAQVAAMRAPEALAAALVADEAECVGIADSRMRDGEVAEGLWLFERIADLPPPNAARLCNLALALRHAGDLARARHVYERAMELAPADPWSWNDYGLMLRVSGDAVAAEAAFRRSLACDARPGEGPGITNLVLAAVLGPATAAARSETLGLASKALAVRPDAALLRRATIDLALGPKTHATAQLETDTAGGRR